MAFPRLGMEGSDHWTGQRGLEKKYSAVQPGWNIHRSQHEQRHTDLHSKHSINLGKKAESKHAEVLKDSE